MKKIIITLLCIIVFGYILFYFFPALVFKPFFAVKYPESEYPVLYMTPTERSLTKSIIVSGQTYKIKDLQFKTSFGEPITKTGAEDTMVTLTFAGKQKVFTGKLENEVIDFTYYNQVINSTPNEFSFFDSRDIFVPKLKNVMVKLVKYPDTVSEFYKFNTPNVRGFQTGIPGKNRLVSLMVFDQNDVGYSIAFNESVTQEEIDAIIQSIQFI